MEGIFVDPQHRMHLIVRSAPLEWVVYTDREERAHIRGKSASSKWITYRAEDAPAADGSFDGEDCIAWCGGTKWHRLHMTYLQYSILFRRQYVPLTAVVLSWVCHFAHWMFRSVRGRVR